MTPDAGNRGLGTAAVVALWTAAVVIFVAGLVIGASALRFCQVVAGLCVMLAGLLVATNWNGAATAMGERQARRWRGRLRAPEASDPAVAARAAQLMAWVWVAIGAITVVFALALLR
jgi:hypothetical protein